MHRILLFISGGFSNWKDASRCFSNCEKTATHKRAVEVVINLPKTTVDIGEMLSSTLAAEKHVNQRYLLKVAHCIKYLARQGTPVRGDKDEMDGNLMQLLHLCAGLADDSQMFSLYAETKKNKYTSPQIQN